MRLHIRSQYIARLLRLWSLTFKLPSWVKFLLHLSSLHSNGLIGLWVLKCALTFPRCANRFPH